MKRRLSAYLLCLLLLLQCIQGQLLYPTKTTTTNQLLVARDSDHRNDEKPSSDRRNNEDGHKDKKNMAAPRVTTEINIIYTTIIYTSASSTSLSTPPAATSLPPLPNVYNVSNTGSAHQEQDPQSASSTNLNDPNNNKKDDLAESLRDDQQALKRMIMILSLVGGLGVIAVVATIVIFTRMRVKNRKQREIDEEGNEGSTFELSHDVDRQSSVVSNTSDNRGGGGAGAGAAEGVVASSITSASSTTSSQTNGRALTEPSAPPALMMIEGLQEPLHRSRRNVVSLSPQTTAPSPSAPTAKELDAMDQDSNSSSSSTAGATTSTPYNHHILLHGHHHHQQEQINSCSRCTPMMMAPELPPPAYTPSAPPHYAMPMEASVMEPSTTSMSASSSMSPLPSRRHSLGG